MNFDCLLVAEIGIEPIPIAYSIGCHFICNFKNS